MRSTKFILTAILMGVGLTHASPQSLLAHADSLWIKRGEPAKARECLQAYAQAAQALPSDVAVWARVARLKYLVANYLETDSDKRDAMLLEGKDAALHALQQLPEYQAEFKNSGSEKKAVLKVGKDGIEPLFWYAADLGRWASDKSIFTKLANKSKLEAFNHRVLELDENFFYGAPHRFFGALPTKVPGGDLNESKAHFEKAVQIAPNYFGNRTLYAELYATKAKDKATFIAQLEYVLKTPADVIPDIAPENHYEQENAKALMAKAPELFK